MSLPVAWVRYTVSPARKLPVGESVTPLKWITSGFVICFSTFAWLSWIVVASEVLFVFRSETAPCRLLTACVFSVIPGCMLCGLLLRLGRRCLGCRRRLLGLQQLLVSIIQLLPQLLNLGLHFVPQRLNLALHRRLLGRRRLPGRGFLGVVEEVLVVPDAVVCASPADIAETSASVASVFSWIFIGPLSFCLVIRSVAH